jgi:hypothetical protein
VTAAREELVIKRKKELKAREERSGINIEVFMVSSIETSTQELATWDASARSWLGTADKAQQAKQKQLVLVLDNIKAAVETKLSSYDSIMHAWRQSLKLLTR